MRRTTSILAAVAIMTTAGMASAQDNRFGVEWDSAAVANMSREDRLAYQRQYKAALEQAAREAGAIPRLNKAKSEGRVVEAASRVPGTSITYHSGVLSPATNSSVSVGNRFDTALTTMGGLGPVEMSGSITMVTFDAAAVGGTAVFFSLFDQVSGTMANLVSSLTVPATTGANTVTFATPLNYVGSSFLAGVWNFTLGTDVVNVATGTVGGQGFHGMSINDLAGTGFNSALTSGGMGVNGAVGVGGNVATPVELMSFSIDE